MVHGRLDEPRLLSRALWLMGFRKRIRISGDSMAPLIRDGDRVFVDPKAYRRRPPRAGDIVLSRHPFRTDTVLVKTVREVGKGNRAFLVGTNGPASTDSRSFGPVPPSHLLGRVTGY